VPGAASVQARALVRKEGGGKFHALGTAVHKDWSPTEFNLNVLSEGNGVR